MAASAAAAASRTRLCRCVRIQSLADPLFVWHLVINPSPAGAHSSHERRRCLFVWTPSRSNGVKSLADPCAAGGRSHGRGGNKRRRGGMGLPESGSRRRCAACHCADALVRLELGLGQFGGAGHMTRKFLMPLRLPGCVWRFGKQDGPTQYLVVSGAAQV